MARKIELADDFRAEERDHVGTFGEEKAGDDFFGDGGTAEDVAAFEDQDFFAGLGQIGCVGEAIVTAADDDHVVVLLRHVARVSITLVRWIEDGRSAKSALLRK